MAKKFDYDARLPFPTRAAMISGCAVEEYLIPDDQKAAVLARLYPFAPVPGLDEAWLDAHEDQMFFIREFRVYREGESNVLASPYYESSGGTVIDWVPFEDEYAGEEDEDNAEAMRGEPTTPAAIDPEFHRWPEKWVDENADPVLCAEMFARLRPFAEQLAASGMATGKLEHYLENLETLGFALCNGGVTSVEYAQPTAAARLAAALGPEGGPELCYHPGGAAADGSFHSTCRQLYAFLKKGEKDR